MRALSVAFATVLAAASMSTAFAADLPVKAPMAPMVSAYNWSGFYAGINGGYGWGRQTDPDITFGDTSLSGYGAYVAAGGFPTASLSPKGFLGGLQLGYNWQTSNFVLGLETDIQGAAIKASATQVLAPGLAVVGTSTVEHKLNWFGTVRGRLGVAQNNWLFYGTGGLIYGGVESSLTQSAPTAPAFFVTDSRSTTRAGWTIGAGTEVGLGKWTAKFEYLYYDMGRDTVTVQGTGVFTGTTYSASQRTAGQILRAGLNYRF